MKHILYKTTNLINNKIYIGVHSTNDINDNYLGSGLNIIRAIKKYGVSNFKREILYIFKTKEEAFLKERELVTEEFVNDNNNYNLSVGGTGAGRTGKIFVRDTNNIGVYIKCEDYKTLKEKGLVSHHLTGLVSIIHNNKHIRIPKEEFSKLPLRGHTYGKTYAFNTKTNQSEYVSKDDLRWRTGELVGNQKGKTWYNDGNKNYFRTPENATGLIPGKKSDWKSPKGKKWYNDGQKAYFLFPTDIKTQNLNVGRKI